MDLLAAYQNELLALVAILVVILIYIKIKRKNEDNEAAEEAEDQTIAVTDETLFEHEEAVENTEDAQTVNQAEQETASDEESIEMLDGKEEGDFGIVESTTADKKAPQEKKIHKRDVPPHAKIVKEDFKEFSGQRLLLAEDNIINQKVIQGLLAESGIEIVVANDGVDALEILEKDDNFIMVLMDAHMPRMDGFEATRKIRENPKYDHIVVVALSGDTAADDIRKMTEAGMTEHLEKPLKMDALYDVLYAYTPDENTSQTDDNYSELDVEEGLEISGDDSEFYHEILEEFIKSYENAHEVIDRFIKHNNIDNADKLLLDIIGVSANIGAQNLNKIAVQLKTSLREDDNHKSRLLFTFKEKLEALIKEIKKYLHSQS
ncbi:response regulator [Sulfurimonas paralvinellae]|nr:response regulator [Sulfurimonas paralvinellae]